MQNGDTGASPRSTRAIVTALRYWASGLLSFRTSRPTAFRFSPGHYARLGLVDCNAADTDAIVWRPFSVVSSPRDSHLEFLAVLVPRGEFSGVLSTTQAGDTVRIDKASYGFMTIDGFAPGKDLWLLASGTGLGPFISILRDPATWDRFENVVVVHSVRRASELAYRDEIASIPSEEALRVAPSRLTYVPVVTREHVAGALTTRITHLLANGELERVVGLTVSASDSRIMVCGNPTMGSELRVLFTARGLRSNRRATPGQLAFENYW